jgi:hypothetical protein
MRSQVVSTTYLRVTLNSTILKKVTKPITEYSRELVKDHQITFNTEKTNFSYQEEIKNIVNIENGHAKAILMSLED